MPTVGQTHTEAVTLRDAVGALVSGATWTTMFAKTKAGATIALAGPTETPAGSGKYVVSFTPATQEPHHLWLKAEKASVGLVQHWWGSVFPTTPQQPNEHVVGVQQEELLVLLDPAQAPILGASFSVVLNSTVYPGADQFAPTVVGLGTAGAYGVRFAPTQAGYRRAELEAATSPVQRFVVEYEVALAGPVVVPAVIPQTGNVAFASVPLVGNVAWAQVV